VGLHLRTLSGPGAIRIGWKKLMQQVCGHGDANAVLSGQSNVSSRIDLKARGLIELSVDDSILSQLISESTAHAYWVKLHKIYQRKSLSSVVFKLRNLVICMQDGRPAQEFIGQVESRARDLQSANILIPDQLISALVVCNLDSRFHTVATALDAHDLDQLSLVKITSLLLNEEARQDQD
jgi:hypothetical protein